MATPHSNETLVPDPNMVARHATVTERGQGVYLIGELQGRFGVGCTAVQAAQAEQSPVAETQPRFARDPHPIVEKIATWIGDFLHPTPAT